ncbi:MAG: NUDIX hydrolase [Chlorobi bacterium]|nr:NUDIX hydrolase [Chlorobiota bacterium]
MYTYKYPRPAFTVDAVVLCERYEDLYILLIRRGREPFRGMWALPGGFLEPEERITEAVKRELAEETGIFADKFRFIGLYDKPDRDPRGRTISAAFLTIVNKCDTEPVHGDDAAEAKWFNFSELPPLAFDHEEIIADVMAMLPDK